MFCSERGWICIVNAPAELPCSTWIPCGFSLDFESCAGDAEERLRTNHTQAVLRSNEEYKLVATP